MSIASELMRLLNLRRELTTILVDKSIISSGNHDLEDDVVAVEALNYRYQSKTTTLGSSTPQTVTPDTGYTGLSRVNVSVSGSITGSKIVQGHKILGVTGTAQSVINLKKVYWTVTVNNASSITVQSSAASCYPAGSFTPGNPLPNVQSSENYVRELIVFRKARASGNISYNEVNFGIEAFDLSGAVYMQTINTGPTLEYPGNMSVSMNNSLTSITISVSGNYRFNGTYLIQVVYI